YQAGAFTCTSKPPIRACLWGRRNGGMWSETGGRLPKTKGRSRCEADEPVGARGAIARHRRPPLSPPAPVSSVAPRRSVHEGPSQGMGAKPILLTGDDPGEG